MSVSNIAQLNAGKSTTANQDNSRCTVIVNRLSFPLRWPSAYNFCRKTREYAAKKYKRTNTRRR